MCVCDYSSEDRSEIAACENAIESVDKSLLNSASGLSTQRLFAAYNLAELTGANQTEQKYVNYTNIHH